MAEDEVVDPAARDDDVARALRVEPLDELTRRRLVGTAASAAAQEHPEAAPTATAAAPTGSRRARALGVAAAAVAFVVLGVAALALPGGDTANLATRRPESAQDRTTAAPTTVAPSAAAPTPAAATERAGSSFDSSAKQALPDLGQLGELGDADARQRVVDAASPLVDGVEPQRWSFTFQTCRPRTLDVVATGLGTVDGEPVQVYVSRRVDGTLRVRALDGTTCELRSLPE